MRLRSSELKAMARGALLGNYGVACGALLLAMAINMAWNFFWAVFRIFTGTGLFLGIRPFHNILLMVGVSLVGMTLSAVFLIGEVRICFLICDGQKPRIEDMFFLFSHHPLRFVGLWLVYMAICALVMVPGWLFSVMLVVWGRYVPLAAVFLVFGMLATFLAGLFLTMLYSMALIALVEDPERGVLECFRHSRMVMRGNILRLIRLWISFLGIYLLGYASLGVGFLWIVPYLCCTVIFFYRDCQAEAFPAPPSFEEADSWNYYRTD